MLEVSHLFTMLPSLSLQRRGDNHPLLLIPGFLAGDQSLSMLKNYLNWLGYKAETWGVGRNTGTPEHLFDHLPEKLREMADKTGESVSLIGQSLGGVFARELARETPQLVRQVITMGSPFGARSSETAIKMIGRLFKQQSGLTIDEMLEVMKDKEMHRSPDVPLTAIFSKCDGVVQWQSCREDSEDRHTQNVEVSGSHCGMGFNAMIYYVIADRLAQDPSDWSHFSWKRPRSNQAF